MKDIKFLLGKRIKELRKKQGLTQEKLAGAANIEIASLSNIENGKNYPNHDTLRKIAVALNVKVYELFIFEHFEQSEVLIEEMVNNMKKDENLTREMYKFFTCIKQYKIKILTFSKQKTRIQKRG